MKFIGQKRIWQELDYLIPAMQGGKNLNIIIRASSGCGKSKLAIMIANFVNSESVDYNIPNDEGLVELDEKKRIIIIDEIHTLKQPEVLYPLLDSGDHIFILCSNEFGELKEPLVNRCIDLNFDDYSSEEIALIIDEDFNQSGLMVPENVVSEIARNCNNTPRIARMITSRLILIFSRNGVPHTENEIKEILRNTLQIEDGLNPLHRRYLDFLQKVDRASLDLISFATRLDKKTIQREIEPILLQRDMIRITSKGRQIQ